MKPSGLIAILAFSMVLAEGQSGSRARELFYTPVPAAAPANPAPKAADAPKVPTPSRPVGDTTPKKAAPIAKSASPAKEVHTVQASVPLGLRYAVLKRSSAGKFDEIDADTQFRSGDRIRLQVDANTSGYLYVVMQGSSGNWRLLFPSSEVAGGNNHVERGQSLQIPPGNQGQFVFDEQAGTEKLFLVLTRQPEGDLDKLIYSMGGAQNAGDSRMLMAAASVRDEVVDKLRSEMQGRDLVFEKVDTTATVTPPANGAPRVENAAYVVNKSLAADARLVVDVSLRHR